MYDKLLYLAMLLLLGWCACLAVRLHYVHGKMVAATDELKAAVQKAKAWQQVADHMLQENGYEPITPLIAEK
jgi:hypothetical protein